MNRTTVDQLAVRLGTLAGGVRRGVAAAVVSAVMAGSAMGQLVNVDFNSGAGATQSGAGLIGAAGNVWNVMPAHSGAEPAHALATSVNTPSGITLAYSGATGGFSDGNNSFSATPFANLMMDYLLVSAGNTATLTFAGLTPSTPYDLILYSNPNQARVRASQFTVNGVAQVASSVGTASTFIPGVNYVRFPSAASSATGGLVVTMTFQSGQLIQEANLNGLQIQPAPLTVGGAFCSTATPIGNGTVFFNTTGATTDGLPEGNLGFCCDEPQINSDVWFAYTASCSGLVTVDMCASGFDTKVAVYNGPACPTAPNSALAGNDDFCNTQSKTTFVAVAGHPYLIRAGGFSTAQGAAQMIVSCNGSGCLAADMGIQGGTAGRDGLLDNNDFVVFINSFFSATPCP